jgi:hypothetical protein
MAATKLALSELVGCIDRALTRVEMNLDLSPV